MKYRLVSPEFVPAGLVIEGDAEALHRAIRLQYGIPMSFHKDEKGKLWVRYIEVNPPKTDFIGSSIFEGEDKFDIEKWIKNPKSHLMAEPIGGHMLNYSIDYLRSQVAPLFVQPHGRAVPLEAYIVIDCAARHVTTMIADKDVPRPVIDGTWVRIKVDQRAYGPDLADALSADLAKALIQCIIELTSICWISGRYVGSLSPEGQRLCNELGDFIYRTVRTVKVFRPEEIDLSEFPVSAESTDTDIEAMADKKIRELQGNPLVWVEPGLFSLLCDVRDRLRHAKSVN